MRMGLCIENRETADRMIAEMRATRNMEVLIWKAAQLTTSFVERNETD